ncbi:hypothetical protein DM02DRAFT_624186 [Periconia macrospinosa]|uniref:RING-type domain-containing protein n=1 Tax=Periconia macrospinosa TaxID=97972 RepID=A0A2V1E8B7_9PLEO|nr:hypothetical protein DM02DRAFT_624186 [Periconia macrospinosa]
MSRYTAGMVFALFAKYLREATEYPHETVLPQPDEDCPTCLEPYELDNPGHCKAIRLVECGHIVGDKCMAKWQGAHANRCLNWNHSLHELHHPAPELEDQGWDLAAKWDALLAEQAPDSLISRYVFPFVTNGRFDDFTAPKAFVNVIRMVFTLGIYNHDEWPSPLPEEDMHRAMKDLVKGIYRRAMVFEFLYILQLLLVVQYPLLFFILDIHTNFPLEWLAGILYAVGINYKPSNEEYFRRYGLDRFDDVMYPEDIRSWLRGTPTLDGIQLWLADCVLYRFPFLVSVFFLRFLTRRERMQKLLDLLDPTLEHALQVHKVLARKQHPTTQ